MNLDKHFHDTMVALDHGYLGAMLEERWDVVQKIAEAALASVGDTSLGPRPVEPVLLGGGRYGVVLPVRGGNWVCKVTSDWVEGPKVAAVIADPVLRWHPGFPVFAGVYRLAGGVGSFEESVYVIVREEVYPEANYREDEASDMIEELGTAAEDLESSRGAMRDYQAGKGPQREPGRLEGFEYNLRNSERDLALRILQARSLLSISNIADAVGLLWMRAGLLAYDLHSGNVGERRVSIGRVLPALVYTHTPGQLVFHDLGGSDSGAPELLRYEVAALARRNPAVRALVRP